jgi:L-2-hydroxyglutarate oxidase LhgO
VDHTDKDGWVTDAAVDFDFDALVVGAGAVGLACGYALARRGLSVAVIEKERAIGQGVSSRNSEVVHGGLYYPTGSLKAQFCVQGRRRLYAFLDSHGVNYDRCGKLVVATEDSEIERLEAIEAQAIANDVEGIAPLSAAQVHALEPDLKAVMALASPQSGIFDSHGYMLALQGEIEDRGGAVVVATPFEGAEPLPGGGFRVRAGGDEPASLTCRILVTAPGLGAQTVAGLIEGFPKARIPTLHYGKGVYFVFHGQARFGPDLQFVESEDYTVDPAKAAGFAAYIRRFWPGLPDDALTPDYAGIRPKIHGPDEPQPDFRLDGPAEHGLPGLMVLFGIESPGLTGSLAIGEAVAERLGLPAAAN